MHVDGWACLSTPLGKRADTVLPFCTACLPSVPAMCLYRNAPHDSKLGHVPSLEGRAGFWDTVKGWGLGMCQVGKGES